LDFNIFQTRSLLFLILVRLFICLFNTFDGFFDCSFYQDVLESFSISFPPSSVLLKLNWFGSPLPQNPIEKISVLLMNLIVPFCNFIPNWVADLSFVQERPNLTLLLLNYGRKSTNPVFDDLWMSVLHLLVEFKSEVECYLLVTHHTNVDVLEQRIFEGCVFRAGIEAGRTVPTMRHFHREEDVSEILAPFDYGRTVAFTLDDLLLNQFQPMQLSLKNGHQLLLILLTVKIED
jgi:hypothetical protein